MRNIDERWRATVEHGEVQFGPANDEARAAAQRGEYPWGRELAPAPVAQAIPVCPICGQSLTARPLDRRFTENNSYLQCSDGHVFQLAAADAEEAVAQALEWADVYEDNMSGHHFKEREASIKRARAAVSRLYPQADQTEEPA